jgi:hypothetical protein
LEALVVPHITLHDLVFELEYCSTVCMLSSFVVRKFWTPRRQSPWTLLEVNIQYFFLIMVAVCKRMSCSKTLAFFQEHPEHAGVCITWDFTFDNWACIDGSYTCALLSPRCSWYILMVLTL